MSRSEESFHSEAEKKIIVALASSSVEEAHQETQRLNGFIQSYKIGPVLVYSSPSKGNDFIRKLQDEYDKKIFVDSKLNDIPRTVEDAARMIATMDVEFLTVTGDPFCVAAAREGVGGRDTKVLAITVLTSREADPQEVCDIASRAIGVGADGVVASGLEARALRERLGKGALIVTPAIRPSFYNKQDDQIRVATPKEAIEAGADYLVVGRPIMDAPDPKEAARAIAAEIAEALDGHA